MALNFGETKGKAIKSTVVSYTYVDGENIVRLFGGILPRYLYWIKGKNNKDIPIECLSFNREKEKFDNKETDYVQEYYPDLKCQWGYSVNCIDPKDGKEKALNLKKKLFEQILSAAEDLGDPTDPDTGWDVVFKRAKTGNHAFNVEYTLSVLRCKPRALTEQERETIAKAQSIDEKYPRPNPEDIKTFLERLKNGATEEDEPTDNATKEAVADLT